MGSETMTLTSIHELIQRLILTNPGASPVKVGGDGSSSVLIEGK